MEINDIITKLRELEEKERIITAKQERLEKAENALRKAQDIINIALADITTEVNIKVRNSTNIDFDCIAEDLYMKLQSGTMIDIHFMTILYPHWTQNNIRYCYAMLQKKNGVYTVPETWPRKLAYK